MSEDLITLSETPPAVVIEEPIERVEAQIVELVGQLAGGTCQLLRLVARYDAAEGWRAWGVASTAHWLAWKCGLDLSTAREHVRVARRLVEHPALITEFAPGRLSYSKVRLITRIANDSNIDIQRG